MGLEGANVASTMMTLAEAAKYVKLHRNTVYKLAKAGRLPAMKLGHQWRFDQAALDIWVSERMADNMESKP